MVLTVRDMVILGALIFCVPFQFWITKLFPPNLTEKALSLEELKQQSRYFITPSLWIIFVKNLCHKYLLKDPSYIYVGSNDSDGECPAIEVMKYKNPNGFFATSTDIRDFRPAGMQFKLGQIVRHKRTNLSGVIIGWDYNCRAPEEWKRKLYGDEQKFLSQPHYVVLFSKFAHLRKNKLYINQDDLEEHTGMFEEPSVEDYFKGHDGVLYKPRDWLRTLYPLG